MKKLLFLPLLAIMFACGSKENEKAIKGLAPVDVYLSLENNGFTTDKSLGGELKSWVSTNVLPGGTLRVETNSSDTNSVEYVRATAMVDITGDIQNTEDFFQMISSFPYEGSDFKVSSKWINSVFNQEKADTIINGVKFTFKNPSKLVKVLELEKE